MTDKQGSSSHRNNGGGEPSNQPDVFQYYDTVAKPTYPQIPPATVPSVASYMTATAPPLDSTTSYQYQPVTEAQQPPTYATPTEYRYGAPPAPADTHFQPVYPVYQKPHEYRGRYPRSYGEDSSARNFLIETGKLALYHLLNAVLGYVAFSVCTTGIVASLVLLPLCCFGIVIFRVVLFAVYGFAQLDVLLYNFIAPPEKHVYVQVPQNPTTGQRLAPTLASFSPLSIMALIYFVTVKVGLATLSSTSFWMAVTAPLGLIGAALGIDDSDFFKISFGPDDVVDYDTSPALFVIASVCLFVVGLALMHIVARVSCAATRFFCCEQFSTYRYVHQHYNPHVQYHPVPMATYGTINVPDNNTPPIATYH